MAATARRRRGRLPGGVPRPASGSARNRRNRPRSARARPQAPGLAELPRPRRHRVLVLLRRHAPVKREPQPAPARRHRLAAPCAPSQPYGGKLTLTAGQEVSGTHHLVRRRISAHVGHPGRVRVGVDTQQLNVPGSSGARQDDRLGHADSGQTVVHRANAGTATRPRNWLSDTRARPGWSG